MYGNAALVTAFIPNHLFNGNSLAHQFLESVICVPN